MNITITGATGFIGRRLVESLVADRHQVHALCRHTGAGLGDAVWISPWDSSAEEPPPDSLANADAVVHLAGEPVAQRWTAQNKARIRDSRVRGTRHLVQALSTRSKRPQALVCASAIGYYGSRGDEILTEASAPGSGFLPEVCQEWEKEAILAEALGIRVVRLRIGVVLGKSGGALAKMLPPFKAGVGGKLGSGKQWMSWIHLDDLVGLIRHAIEQPLSGALNGVGPNPATNAALTSALAGVLRRPAIFPVPGFVAKTLFGEMAEVILGSQKVLPKAAEAAGYKFRYPELRGALEEILK
ncbi:MAG: TIGR01777 family protein [Acidobacteria bacterium]|nr:TIGR01777 family protein [Acidobacteriota bacterium]MBI3474084.1 TIGR01777 family protein [Candidatus Solibacter usitatus]